MLRDGRRSVAEISDALRFSAPTAFRRAFHRWTGRSPRDHRAQLGRRAPGERSASWPAEPTARPAREMGSMFG
ncbi:hypothetical protein [Sorangium sp. So ce1097]|uniref:hypothetical protein n=1 Tax=Sorangium sp. So ce1097 TaxID=3133330 RepID=UPI003F62E19B